MSDELVLYREPLWISPYVFAVFVTLTEKRLPFESRALDFSKGETATDAYLARTVTGRVPSLVHGGVALAESSAIIEYLEERFPDPPVLPSSIAERARCRQIMSWLRSDDTARIREERPTTTMFYEPAQKPLGAEAAKAAEKLIRVTEAVVGSRPSLFERWCIADSELAFMLHRLILSGDPVPDGARAYAEAQWQRPSVQAFVGLERPPSR